MHTGPEADHTDSEVTTLKWYRNLCIIVSIIPDTGSRDCKTA